MIFRLFLTLWISLFSLQGWGAALIEPSTQVLALDRHVTILEDPGGILSLAEAQGKANEFVPVKGNGEINLGYSDSHWWFRVELQAAPDLTGDWRLQIAYPPLDSVEIWIPAGKQVVAYQTGDRQIFARRPTPHRNFVFPLRLVAGETSVVYLRVASAGTLTVPMQVLSETAHETQTEKSYALHALYFGMLFALGTFNLLLFFAIRDRAYLLYVVFVFGLGLGQAGQAGLAAQYLWPDTPLLANLAYPLGFALAGLFGTCFTRAFLNTDQQLPRLNLVLRLHGYFFIGGAGLSLLSYRYGAQLLSATGVLFACMAVWVGLVSWRRGNPSARIFLIAWLLLLIGAAAMGLRTLDLVPTNTATLYGLQIGSALEMLLLSFALADRITHMRREKLAAQSEALKAERRIREILEENERRLENRVVERTRELENANQQLKENEERFRKLAQHDALTGLANRLLLFDRLEHLLQRSRRSNKGFAVLMLDLDGFKLVNDTHGHAAGDALLAKIGRRLVSRVRSSDTVARIGGDEFAILLEDSASQTEAQLVADNLLEAIGEPITLESEAIVKVGGSIGIAIWPDDGNDAERLLRAADRAMYRAKSSSEQV